MATSKRRLSLRFSLLTLLAVPTLLAVFLGLQANRANNQRSVVRWITLNGGSVHYDWQFVERDGIDLFIGDADNRPRGPAWLRERIGDEYFQEVVGVYASSEDLSRLATLKNLRWLYVRDAPVKDVTPLAKLSKLERLGLTNSQVKDVSALSRLHRLEVLYLNGSQVRDLSPLLGLTRLDQLVLDDSQVSDLSPLGHLTNLQILNLARTPIDDLSPLLGLSRLTDLHIEGTSLSEEQIDEFQRARPHCTIWR